MRRVIIIGLLLMFVAGCTTYHRVTDLNTGMVYYSEELHQKSGGAVEFKDGRTGHTIVLPSTEVREITKEQYQQGIYLGK